MDSRIIEMFPGKKEESYHQYKEQGGIINEQDYQNALQRANDSSTIFNKTLRVQAEGIAGFAEIELHNEAGVIDPRIKLYVILRGDVGPAEVKHHHDEMSDQRLFAEALRMLGDTESLDKMIRAYKDISLGDFP